MAVIDNVLDAADALRRAMQNLATAQAQRLSLNNERAALVQQTIDADADIVTKQTEFQQAKVAFKALVGGL